jgi:ABC-type Na+ efflux pump permease subunit
VFGAVFLLYGLLAVYGQWVAQGIVEEKQSRVVEVLLASLRPTELLAGKILGLGALGLVQILLLAGVAAGGLLATDVIEVPPAAWGALGLVIPWYVLGFLLYATLFAMAGAIVSRVEDMQSAVMPVIIVLVLALFAAQFALAEPTSTVATVAGLLPLTAPIVQPILLAVGATSWVQVLLAIVLALTAIAVMVPLSARIYRGGVLRTHGAGAVPGGVERRRRTSGSRPDVNRTGAPPRDRGSARRSSWWARCSRSRQRGNVRPRDGPAGRVRPRCREPDGRWCRTHDVRSAVPASPSASHGSVPGRRA